MYDFGGRACDADLDGRDLESWNLRRGRSLLRLKKYLTCACTNEMIRFKGVVTCGDFFVVVGCSKKSVEKSEGILSSNFVERNGRLRWNG